MTEALLISFANSFEGEIHWDELHRQLYATDASVYRKLPTAVAFPRSEYGIQQVIIFAAENGIGIIPRTAGTSLAGQCVGEGIVVDVSKHMTAILDLDIDNRQVTVQPGVIRDELNEYLRPYGLFFGPNTSTSSRCMIGGMVGNNSSGTTSIRYGVTRDKLIRLKTILSNGETITFEDLGPSDFKEKCSLSTAEGNIYRGIHSILSDKELQQCIQREFPNPDIHRRNTGYALDALIDCEVFTENTKPLNICKLLCGSEGTLAFTTEITLNLDKLPPAESVMVVAHYNELQQCLDDVVSVMDHELYSCELMDDIILDCTKQNKKYDAYRFFVHGNPKALLMLELRADTPADLDTRAAALMDSLNKSQHAYHTSILKGVEISTALELRKAGLGLLGNMIGDGKAVACIEDTAVSLRDLPSYIADFTRIMRKYDQKAVYYAHAGAGELHLRPILNLKNREGVGYFRKITTEVASLVKRYGGSFSGEHGDGIVRGEFVEFMLGKANYEAMRKIKATFDPEGVMNPGKLVDPVKMDESLRYETGRTEPKVDSLMDFSDTQGILRLAENCNGSGECRQPASSGSLMCPSYQASLDEKDSTRGRANVLREVLTGNKEQNKYDAAELKEVMDLCLSCKGCASDCPSNVNIATAKAEFLYQYRKSHPASRSDKLFGFSSRWNQKAARIPGLFNLLSGSVFGAWIKKFSGIATKRNIPRINPKSTQRRIQLMNTVVDDETNVLLFIDEFCSYMDGDIALDAYELLEKLGYKVAVVNGLDSARALISKGFLEEARRVVDSNIDLLRGLVNENRPLLGIEPSALLGFRDEFIRLASDKESAEKIAANAFLIEEFLATEAEAGNIGPHMFTSDNCDIKIHVHCHQKALSNQKFSFDVLNLPENYHPTLISSGCCGMAGSFGYEKEHYEFSMKIGAMRLFPAVNKTTPDTIVVANGTSCRQQICDGTGRSALHPVTVLRHALK